MASYDVASNTFRALQRGQRPDGPPPLPPLDVPCTTAPILDACAFLHLAMERATDGGGGGGGGGARSLAAMWRAAEAPTLAPPVGPGRHCSPRYTGTTVKA